MVGTEFERLYNMTSALKQSYYSVVPLPHIMYKLLFYAVFTELDWKSFLPDNDLELSDFSLVKIQHFVKIDPAVLKHRQQTYIHS